MAEQTLEITGVLSDPTRFSIYQFVNRQHREVTVQEIAETFSIHANVARLHLTKLEDVKMLVSSTKKTGKSGRPSRFYGLSEEVVSLQFPYRDYQRLAELTIQSLASIGTSGEEALIKVGHQFGYESARSFMMSLGKEPDNMSVTDKVAFIEKIALNQGLNPEINIDQDTNEIVFSVYNCIFKELVPNNPVICHMHHAQLNGIFSYFFKNIDLSQRSSMLEKNTMACTYTAIALDKE